MADQLKLIIKPYPEDGIAEIYFSFRDHFFPSEHWTDLKRVLSVWRSALSDDGSDDTLFFMDGPYWFGVHKMDRDAYLFAFYDESEDALEPVTRYVATRAEYRALRQTLMQWA